MPMLFEHEIEVDLPVGEVYRAFHDPANMPRWLTGFQRLEPIEGRPGEVGSKSRHVYLERGRTIELIETVTAHEPEERFAGELDGGGMTCAIEVRFVDLGDRTRVLARSDFRARSFLVRLMMPFIRGGVRKRQMGDFERFKTLLEAGELACGKGAGDAKA